MNVSLIVKKHYNGQITLDLIESEKADLNKVLFLPMDITGFYSSASLDLREILNTSSKVKSILKTNALKVFDLNKKKLCAELDKALFELGKPYGVQKIETFAFQEIPKRANEKGNLIFIKSNMQY